MSDFPSYDPVDGTPAIDPEEFGIHLLLAARATRARYPASGEWPLFGAYRVGADTIKELGADPLLHVRLVVVHAKTSVVRVGTVAPDAEIHSDGLDVDAEGAMLLALRGYFAIDLSRQVGLPREPASYWVVALVGGHHSEMVRIDVE